MKSFISFLIVKKEFRCVDHLNSVRDYKKIFAPANVTGNDLFSD